MHLSALKYFLTVVEKGSLRRASEALYVAPSAISRQIALLEQRFGAPLIDRDQKGFRLTPAGELVAQQARNTLHDIDRLKVDIDDLQAMRRGLIRIASVEGVVSGLLYDCIGEFVAKYPSIRFDIQVMGGDAALEAVAREDCDIAISYEPKPHPDVLEHCHFQDPIVAVMATDHPLARTKTVELKQLLDFPLTLLGSTHATRRIVDRLLAESGLLAEPRMNVSLVSLAALAARCGLSVTVLPRLAVKNEVAVGRLRVVPLADARLQAARFVVCRHRHRPLSRPATAFLQVLENYVSALAVDATRRPPSAPVLKKRTRRQK
jgi:DNA-binding transcriptional LysR family regulator